MVKRKKVDSSAIRKNPVRSVRKVQQQIASFNESIASSRCKEWLQEQKKIRKEVRDEGTDINEINDIAVETSNSQNFVQKVKIKTRRARLPWKKMKNVVDFCCEWKRCNAEISDEIEYDDHVMAHAMNIVPNEDLYECLWDLCGFVSNDSNALTRHLSFHIYHSKLKTYGDSFRQTIDFPQCSYDSRNRNFFPDTDYDYPCLWQNCHAKFNSIVDFFNHVQMAHCSSLFKGIPVQCKWESCNKVCTKLAFLVDHVKVHTREKQVACPHCGAMFRNYSDMFDHCERQSVNNTQEYQCEHCSKTFPSERLLRAHMRGHINSLKCTMCDMTCSKPYDLARHIRYKHMTEKPFNCKFCTYRAVAKHDIVKHQTIHFDETHECNKLECNFKTTSNNLLRKHTLIEHGEGLKTFACHCCEQTYNYSSLLSRHLRNKHNFQRPSGHSRFTYKKCTDGIYRLQTVRVESVEVMRDIIQNDNDEEEDNSEDEVDEVQVNPEYDNLVEIQEDPKYDYVVGDEMTDMESLHVDEEYNEDLEMESESCVKSINDFKIMKYLKK